MLNSDFWEALLGHHQWSSGGGPVLEFRRPKRTHQWISLEGSSLVHLCLHSTEKLEPNVSISHSTEPDLVFRLAIKVAALMGGFIEPSRIRLAFPTHIPLCSAWLLACPRPRYRHFPHFSQTQGLTRAGYDQIVRGSQFTSGLAIVTRETLSASSVVCSNRRLKSEYHQRFPSRP